MPVLSRVIGQSCGIGADPLECGQHFPCRPYFISLRNNDTTLEAGKNQSATRHDSNTRNRSSPVKIRKRCTATNSLCDLLFALNHESTRYGPFKHTPADASRPCNLAAMRLCSSPTGAIWLFQVNASSDAGRRGSFLLHELACHTKPNSYPLRTSVSAVWKIAMTSP